MNKIFQIVVVLLLMYVSLRIGHNIGTTKAFDVLYTENVNSVAVNIKVKVKALDRFKSGETAKAIELLERTIDNDLCFLSVSNDNKHLKSKADLLEAIRDVKEYRLKYPGYIVHHSANNCVNKAYEIIK